MPIVLSHPFSSALFFWFAELEKSSVTDPGIKHPYYRALFRNARDAVNIAIGALIVYDEVVIPAVDAPFPGHGWAGGGRLPQLGLLAEWEPVHEARDIFTRHRSLIESDPTVRDILSALPSADHDIEVHYAIADVLFSDHFSAPVICSPGRSRLAERICQLGVMAGHLQSTALDAVLSISAGRAIHAGLSEHQRVSGFVFKRDELAQIESVRSDPAIAGYARNFRKALQGLATDGGSLIDSMADAAHSATVRSAVAGSFTTTSRLASVLSLVPGVGSVFGIGALASDAASSLTAKGAARASWFELSTEIQRHQTLELLKAAVDGPASTHGSPR